MIDNIRKSFAASEACPHGGRVREAAACLGSEPLDFSANINPLGSPPLEDIIAEEIKKLGQYPDNTYLEFRKAAGSFAGVDAESIVPGNGSSEVIRLFAETVLEDGDLAIVPFPTFGEYEAQSRLFGADVHKAKLAPSGRLELSDALLKDAQALFFCNPNNPTGRLLPGREIEELARRCERSETFFLVDEAFIELSDPDQSVVRLAPGMDYLLVMRSLTKSFAVPGLRLGFAAANQALAEVMNRARIPWSISSIASAAGPYLLRQEDYLERARALIRDERAYLTDELKELGLAPLDSSVNFILVNLEPAGIFSDDLARAMLHQGILVRDCQSFGLGRAYIRIAVRNRDENKRLIAALKQAIPCIG